MTPAHQPALKTSYRERAQRVGWSQERDDRVAEMYVQGYTLAEIGEDVGTSRGVAIHIVRRLRLHRVIPPNMKGQA